MTKCQCGHTEADHTALGPALRKKYGNVVWCEHCQCREFKAEK
jgi:hypothetical protein